MLAARFRQRNSVLGESARRARSLDSCSTWNVGDLIEFGHWQGDGGDATREEDVGRREQIGAVMVVAGLDIVCSYTSHKGSSFIHSNFYCEDGQPSRFLQAL